MLAIDPIPILSPPLSSATADDTTTTTPVDSEALLREVARDGAQALINQLLLTCPLTTSTSSGVLLILPPPTTPLPREKTIPSQNKPLTKWQAFAAKKGIAPKRRDGKVVFDEDANEWVPKYGYQGPAATSSGKGGTRQKKVENDWLVEVDDTKTQSQKAGEEHRPRSDGNRKRAGGGMVHHRKQKKVKTERLPSSSSMAKKGKGRK